MDFKNANELLTLCEEQNISISEVMRNREIITGECPAKEADQKMARVLEIMKEAARSPIEKPIRSMGGLIGGEAQKLAQHSASGQGLCGELLEKAITYAMATLETNASMGLIVASPTAGIASRFSGSIPFLRQRDSAGSLQCGRCRLPRHAKCHCCRCCRRVSG